MLSSCVCSIDCVEKILSNNAAFLKLICIPFVFFSF